MPAPQCLVGEWWFLYREAGWLASGDSEVVNPQTPKNHPGQWQRTARIAVKGRDVLACEKKHHCARLMLLLPPCRQVGQAWSVRVQRAHHEKKKKERMCVKESCSLRYYPYIPRLRTAPLFAIG